MWISPKDIKRMGMNSLKGELTNALQFAKDLNEEIRAREYAKHQEHFIRNNH